MSRRPDRTAADSRLGGRHRVGGRESLTRGRAA
jgi:hypothetical protein